jgi:CHRD domain
MSRSASWSVCANARSRLALSSVSLIQQGSPCPPTRPQPPTLIASLEGRNEVTGGAVTGLALEFIGIRDNTLTYTIAWRGIGTPTAADIHAGARGVDGPVVIPFFTPAQQARGVVSGSVTVDDPTLLAALRTNPNGFYADVHTNRFPAGAVRAQLHLLTHRVATSGVAVLQESVVRGSQIYACTVQGDGTFGFAQSNVEARLGGDIHHTFVQPAAWPPQWQAPDGSAVSGKVVTKNANGDANIAKLNLDATYFVLKKSVPSDGGVG